MRIQHTFRSRKAGVEYLVLRSWALVGFSEAGTAILKSVVNPQLLRGVRQTSGGHWVIDGDQRFLHRLVS